jgi:hypothetical protein
MAPVREFPDTQTRIFNFPDLTAAFAQSPDANFNRKENLHQAANGAEADIWLCH